VGTTTKRSLAIIIPMTTVEILFRYEQHPTEAAMSALNNLSEVYGIRSIQLKEAAKTIRVEYDATRLNAAIVTQLLRRAGINIAEELPLIPPQPPAAAEPAPAPAK
jgi:copper chaperone CopZ